MEDTKVMVYFSAVGDCFPVDEITQELNIEPTETYLKGDIIKSVAGSQIVRRKENDWTLGTGYQKSFDINDQLKQLLKLLTGKTVELIEIRKKYELTYLFMIVVEVENNEKPAMYLERDIIDFASSVQAEIHFDLYINS